MTLAARSLFITALALPLFAADPPKPDAAAIEFFEKDVRPVLAARCFSCHGSQQQFSSLRVDSREALLKGGNRGPALVPGDAKLSLLARAVRQEGLKLPQNRIYAAAGDPQIVERLGIVSESGRGLVLIPG